MGDRDVAFEDGTVAENQNLSYPIVHYPGHYGAFFAFSKDRQSVLTFCSCTKEAIENYIEFRIRHSLATQREPKSEFHPRFNGFPIGSCRRA